MQGAASGIEKGAGIIDRSRAIANESGDARLKATVALYSSCIHIVRGEFERALHGFDATTAYLQKHCVGVTMEHNLAKTAALVSLEALGRFGELAARSAAWEAEARGVGNLFAQLTAMLNAAIPLLAGDDPEGARARARETRSRWTRKGVHVQHIYALRIELYADLYDGDARAAHDRIRKEWRAIVLSGQLQVQPARMDMLLLRARRPLRRGHHELFRDSPARSRASRDQAGPRDPKRRVPGRRAAASRRRGEARASGSRARSPRRSHRGVRRGRNEDPGGLFSFPEGDARRRRRGASPRRPRPREREAMRHR